MSSIHYWLPCLLGSCFMAIFFLCFVVLSSHTEMESDNDITHIPESKEEKSRQLDVCDLVTNKRSMSIIAFKSQYSVHLAVDSEETIRFRKCFELLFNKAVT